MENPTSQMQNLVETVLETSSKLQGLDQTMQELQAWQKEVQLDLKKLALLPHDLEQL